VVIPYGHYFILKEGFMAENFKKYFVELIGTFFLVFVVGATAAWGTESTIAPIAIGFTLMVMVYAGGYISGGHYNPAVSFAAAIRGALEWKQFIPYIIAQILGGVLAGFTIVAMAGGLEAPVKESYNLVNIFVAEFIATFALCYVVLHTATSKKTEGNSYYGLAIGSTVTAMAFAVGGICLGAFNPAVAISTIVLGNVCCPCLALGTAGVNLAAGLCAGFAYKFLSQD
jgi:aquaporin Z